ncbi:MAG: 50S ribosome-binding GTPase [Proteobacteria bacterium]|uniref:GTPase n=1 Tax=Rudaea sp. TaxID=2136325 RepID=UPI003220393E|nr:50S ribosome-binding GTPase [Pseudomonadota bacterium]
MANSSRPLRLILIAVLALVLAAALWATIAALRGGIALWQELRDLPAWLQYAAAGLLGAVVLGFAWLAWRLLRPRPRKPVVARAPERADVQARLDVLAQQRADTEELQSELAELDRRARGEQLYVAVFGEISAGKSSLVRALTSGALADEAAPASDVLGGTTRAVAHYPARIGEARAIYADVPGTHEVSGKTRETIARDEALRAHVVLYVCAGDLTREQDAELRWLRGFGKPLVLVLNKADQLFEAERLALAAALRQKYGDATDAQVVVSAGGTQTVERRLADGRVETATRERAADVGALVEVLARQARSGAAALEPAREAAVLSRVDARAAELEAGVREREAEAVVAKYTKRAVVGALAAVMPGSDLVIQAVLATGLVRELSKLYGVPVRDIDIDAFVAQVKLTVRTSASLVLAIAGNAAKAFPGLGTLGGGVLHAIAYGLIFDSLGRAVATTLRERHALDRDAAASALSRLLADTSADRLRRIARLALQGEKEEP